MPPHRRAFKGARPATAIALAVLVLPALPVAAQADGPAPTLAVQVGYHDLAKTGEWMPVSIEVRNGGADFSGTVEVQLTNDPANLQAAGGAAYVLPVTLPRGSIKHLRTYVASDASGSPVRVRVVGAGGRVLVSERGSATITTRMLVGVLSDDPTAFDELAASRYPNGSIAQVVHLTREDIPNSAVFLHGFDLLAIDDFASDSLTPTQRRAIEGYVALGGSLLLGSGGAWRKTLGALPAGLLPLTPTGTQTAAGSRALQTSMPMEVVTGSATGTAWLQEGGRPLILEQAFGQGLVTMAAFDWTTDPAASSTATRSLLRQVGLRSGFGTRLASAAGGPIGTVWFTGASSGSITQRSNNFLGALSNLPSLELPSLRLIGLLVLLYVVVVGPLNFLVLMRAGRRELAWITVPLIAVAFAGGAYGLALGTKGKSVQANQISIIHLAGAGDQAYQETYTGIFAPTRGDYSVSLGGPQPAIAPAGNLDGGYGLPAGSIRLLPDQPGVDLLGVTAFTLRGYATESAVEAPTLTASLSLHNGRLTGVVHNGSKLHFTGGLLVFGTSYQRLSRLSPGADLPIDVPLQTYVLNGLQPINPMSYTSVAIDQAVVSGQPARVAQDRTAILQSLLAAYGRPLNTAVTPVLLAWTSDPLQDLRVNGAAPRLQSESAVVLPATLAGPIVGPIPAGLVTSRLVDASGEVAFGPSSTILDGSSATYELKIPLAPGSRLVNPTITSTDPYWAKAINVPLFPPGAPAGVTPTTSALTAEYWDWAGARWVPFQLKDNTANPLPDGGVDASGTIRVRLTASLASTPAQMGWLSLGGTVQ
jgi:hypothetical protein